jgi:hypothetical protein
MSGDKRDRAQPVSDESLDQAVGGTATPDDIGGSLTTMSELGVGTQLGVQQAVDQQTKANQVYSNTLKKYSDTASGITGNLK